MDKEKTKTSRIQIDQQQKLPVKRSEDKIECVKESGRSTEMDVLKKIGLHLHACQTYQKPTHATNEVNNSIKF